MSEFVGWQAVRLQEDEAAIRQVSRGSQDDHCLLDGTDSLSLARGLAACFMHSWLKI